MDVACLAILATHILPPASCRAHFRASHPVTQNILSNRTNVEAKFKFYIQIMIGENILQFGIRSA